MAHSINAFRAGFELPPVISPKKSPMDSKNKTSFRHDETRSTVDSEDRASEGSTPASTQPSILDPDTSATDQNASNQENPETPTAPKSVRIRYSLEIYDTLKTEWSTLEQNDAPFDLGSACREPTKDIDPTDKPPAIFEVCTKANGFDTRRKKKFGELRLDMFGMKHDESPPASKPEEEEEPLKLEHLKITEVTETRIEIHSHPLLEAIREIVDYYPNQNLTGDVVIIHEPYWILVHHEKELKKLEAKLSEPPHSTATEDDKNASKEKAEHIRVLLEFIQPQIDRLVPPIQRRLQKKVPTITFDTLWYLLRPGTFVYCQYDNEWIGAIIMRVKGKMERSSKSIARWNILVWFLDYNASLFRGYTASGDKGKHVIHRFEGEQDVTSLKVIPREYWDVIDGGARREQFEARGLKKIKLLQSGFKQMNYKGESLERRRRTYHSRVIVDDRRDLQVPDEADTIWMWNTTDTLKDESWINSRHGKHASPLDSSQRLSKLADLLLLENDDPSKLSRDQCFLISPDVPCYAHDIKSWYTAHIERLHEMEVDKTPTKLVMETSHLQIIKSLSYSQISAKTTWSADSIKDKGKGVIILLHGPPGVGKTYSVECTAAATGRPLLALTIADIGTKEDKIENELSSWFYLAERWKAVLLIDEADIFLERRKHTDLARNGVVSAFLRKMEYFSGLLFLTTNRVGHIDEAFMSRVHVVIGYPQLDDNKRREIWQGFLDKMRLDTGGQIRLSPSAKTYVMQDAKDLKIKLNGREIRNSLQTAIALAQFEAKEDPDYVEGEPIKVEKDHFERVLSMSRSFRNYLDSIKRDTAEWRAANLYGRNDYDDPPIDPQPPAPRG